MLLLQHQHARMMAAGGGGGNMVERSESLSSGVSSSTSMPSPSCCGAGGSAATIARLRQFHQLLMAVCQFYRVRAAEKKMQFWHKNKISPKIFQAQIAVGRFGAGCVVHCAIAIIR
jgi:hypothetical protein